jgi:hypothetical protein
MVCFNDGAILKGGVTEDSSKSPIIQGVVEELPTGTKVSMISQCYLNSQLSQTGDAVTFRIAHDVRDGKGNRVVVPGDWVAHGFVTQATKPGRNGVPGRVDVKIVRLSALMAIMNYLLSAKFLVPTIRLPQSAS